MQYKLQHFKIQNCAIAAWLEKNKTMSPHIKRSKTINFFYSGQLLIGTKYLLKKSVRMTTKQTTQPNPISSIQQDQQNQTQCEICNMKGEQIRCIMFHLLSSLKQIDIDGIDQNMYDNGGFTKLLRMIFHARCRNFRDSIKCNHLKARDFFLECLNTNPANLNRLSNKKLNSLAKYNYHMDTISQQIKTFHRHFVGIDKKKHIKSKNKIRQLTPEKTQKTDQTQKKNTEKSPSPKYPNIKQEHNEHYQPTSHFPPSQQFTDFRQLPTPYTYHHPIVYNTEYSHLMNNMLMMNYGYNPGPHQP